MFAVITAGILIVILMRMIPWWKREREEAAHRPEPTAEEKARDANTAKIWGCVAVTLPLLLVLAYLVTR